MPLRFFYLGFFFFKNVFLSSLHFPVFNYRSKIYWMLANDDDATVARRRTRKTKRNTAVLAETVARIQFVSNWKPKVVQWFHKMGRFSHTAVGEWRSLTKILRPSNPHCICPKIKKIELLPWKTHSYRISYVMSWIRMVYFTHRNEGMEEWLLGRMSIGWELNSFQRCRSERTKQRFEVVAMTGDDGRRRQRINGLRRFIEHTLTLTSLQVIK